MAIDNTPIACGVMPRVPKPTDPGNPAQVRAYRSALARRHLRENLYTYGRGTYTNGWFLNIWELLLRILAADRGAAYLSREIAIVDSAQSKLRPRGLKQFTTDQKARNFSGITEEQYNVLLEAIAESPAELLECASHESWIHHCDKGVDKFLARDSTVTHDEWERIAGMHSEPLTLVKIKGSGDVAAVDELLCIRHLGAVEQQLEDPETGRYRFEPSADGCFVVRVYRSERVAPACSLVVECGFEVSSVEPQPLTEKQQDRLQRWRE